MEVRIASHGESIKPGIVYFAPSEVHLELVNNHKIELANGPKVCYVRPAADITMKSVRKAEGYSITGIIMTGMGRDGSNGCKHIRQRGGFVFGQDEATSDVYGMNKVAFAEGHVDRQFSLNDAATIITRQVARLWCRSRQTASV